MMEFLCRTCLKINLTPCNIFESFNNGELISESLTQLASLKIQKDDRFPDNICQNCLQNLTLIHDFKLMIVDSNRKLLRRIHDPIIKNDTPIQANTSKEIFPKKAIKDHDNEEDEFLSCKGDDQNSPEVNTRINCQVAENTEEDILEEGNCDSQANDKIEIIDLDLESPDCIRDSFQTNLENGTCTTNNLIDSNRKLLRGIHNPIIKNDTSEEMFPKEAIENEQDGFLSCEGDDQNSPEDNTYINCQNPEIMEEDIPGEENYDSHVNDTIEIIDLDLESPNCIRDSLQANLENGICTGKNLIESNITSLEKIDNSNCEIQESHPSPVQTHKKRKASCCVLCKKYFENKHLFREHLLIHRNNKDYVCNICHETFTSMRKLKGHLPTHKEKKDLRLCLVCGKTFKHNKYVKTHMLIHSKEKQYKCKLCPSAYDAKCSLDIHMKKHEGYVQQYLQRKPYLCTESKGRHYDSTGWKSHHCMVCGKTFFCERYLGEYGSSYKEKEICM